MGMVKFFKILIFFSLVIHTIRGVSIPKVASLSPRTDSDVPTDWQSFAQNLLGTRAGRRTNKLDIESPSARAALAYLKSNLVEDNLCADVAQTYISTIKSGGSPAAAKAIAAGVYVRNYEAGVRSAPGSPCEAADIAFRKAVADGDDPVMFSALAFMNTYKSESPCFALHLLETMSRRLLKERPTFMRISRLSNHSLIRFRNLLLKESPLLTQLVLRQPSPTPPQVKFHPPPQLQP